MTKKAQPDKKGKSGAPVQKRPVKKTDSVRQSLANELCSLIPKLDAEGLAFLVEQARIHHYNMQVDELNNAARKADIAAARSRQITEKARKTRAQKGIFKLDATGTGFYLRCNNDGVMFSKSEMVQLVKIANGQGNALEIANRLYSWFERERIDILNTFHIIDKFDDRLKNIAAMIKKNIKLKKNG